MRKKKLSCVALWERAVPTPIEIETEAGGYRPLAASVVPFPKRTHLGRLAASGKGAREQTPPTAFRMVGEHTYACISPHHPDDGVRRSYPRGSCPGRHSINGKLELDDVHHQKCGAALRLSGIIRASASSHVVLLFKKRRRKPAVVLSCCAVGAAFEEEVQDRPTARAIRCR